MDESTCPTQLVLIALSKCSTGCECFTERQRAVILKGTAMFLFCNRYFIQGGLYFAQDQGAKGDGAC